MNRLTIVLLLLAVGLGLLVVNHNGGRTLGIDNDQFAQVLYLLPIAGLLSAGILAGRRGNFGTVIRQMGHLMVDPSADRIWRRIAETQEGAAEQASPRVRLVVDPPR